MNSAQVDGIFIFIFLFQWSKHRKRRRISTGIRTCINQSGIWALYRCVKITKYFKAQLHGAQSKNNCFSQAGTVSQDRTERQRHKSWNTQCCSQLFLPKYWLKKQTKKTAQMLRSAYPGFRDLSVILYPEEHKITVLQTHFEVPFKRKPLFSMEKWRYHKYK